MLWLDVRQLGARAQFISPWSALEASAKANLSRDKRSLDLTVNKDGRELVAVAASCVQTTAVEGKGSRLEPTMTVSWRQRPLLDMRGSISYVTSSKYSADLTIGGLTQKPIALAMDLSRLPGQAGQPKWDLTASAKNTGLDAALQGSVRWAPPLYISTKLTANYKLGASPRQDIDLAAKYHSNDKGALSRRGASVNLQVSQTQRQNVSSSRL